MALLEQYSTRSYIEAGADVIQTNTYGANFEKLKSFGLEHKVKRN